MRRVALYGSCLAVVLGALLLPAAAAAQVPANARWVEHESEHFRTTYPPDLEPLARHVTAAAERAHAALRELVADAPSGRIDIVLTDNIDLSNGYATPFPSNRIVLFARPPTDALELQYTRDWLELVTTHELAHIFHLDTAGRLGRLLRALFGRVPMPWPLFPSVGTPAWSVEGLAVGIESAVTDLGRIHGSYHEMVVRTAALAGRLDEYDRLSSSSARWPGPGRVYIYGSLFMDYLARRHGADAAARIVSSAAGAIIPPSLWFDRVGRRALGTSFRAAYAEWRDEVTERALNTASAVESAGATHGEALTSHDALALYPRFSPDAARIAYAAYDWRSPPRLRVIDAATGAEQWSERVNLPAPAAWITERAAIAGDVEFTSRFHILGDLRVVGDGDRRVTHAARVLEPHAAGGRVVAVQTEGGTNRVVLIDPGTGAVTPLTPYEPDVQWSLPRLSPDARSVAVARWRLGGTFDIVVMAVDGTSPRVVVEGPGINGAPAWSPDGRLLLFWSDRSGIPNIYATDLAADPGNLRQVTNVVTGAYFPDVSPDGRWLAYAAYGADGFRIERMPFAPSTWRAPRAASNAFSLTERTEYHPADEDPTAVVQRAFTSADTSSGDQRRYRALRSLRPYYWLPLIATDDTDELYFGVWSEGRDLVGRHAWNADVAFSGSGRTRGGFAYRYNGLPELPGIGMHPSLTAAVSREWDEYLPRAAAGEPYADEREDAVAAGIDLTRQRWRSVSGLSFAGELIARSRRLYDAPGLRLADPDDDLHGVRAAAYYSRYVVPPRAISRESGFTVQLTGRQRWDRTVRTVEREDGSTDTFDGSYRELVSWNALYLTLPLPGFARHVLGVRTSALLRDGPGSGFSSIGGASASGASFAAAGLQLAGSSSLLLPVRGFQRGVRAGPRAWTASLEYRFPLALIDAPLRPLFLDRLSGALFLDAGHAWCDDDVAARVEPRFCPSTSATDAPLLAAGGEATLLFGLLGVSLPLRAGVGYPLRGVADRKPRAYIAVGASF